jgi:predicted transposase YdaD
LRKVRAKDLEEGRQKRRREIALAMLQNNLPLEQVSKLTVLSIKEIESLKK